MLVGGGRTKKQNHVFHTLSGAGAVIIMGQQTKPR